MDHLLLLERLKGRKGGQALFHTSSADCQDVIFRFTSVVVQRCRVCVKNLTHWVIKGPLLIRQQWRTHFLMVRRGIRVMDFILFTVSFVLEIARDICSREH